MGSAEQPARALARVLVRLDADPATIVAAGELDLSTLHLLRPALDEIVAAGRRTVVVDLTDVTFVDLAALRVLASAGAAGLAVELRNPSPLACRVLEITGVGDHLRWESVEA